MARGAPDFARIIPERYPVSNPMSSAKSDYAPFGLISGMGHTGVMDLDPSQRRAALQQFVDEAMRDRNAKFSIARWQREAGVGEGTVRHFLSGATNSMDEKTYVALAPAAERILKRPVSVARLKGESMDNDQKLSALSDIRNIDPSPPLPQGSEMTRDVPVYGTISGEAGGLLMGSEYVLDRVRRPPRFQERLGKPKDIFAALVDDISMFPKYEPGDLIYIDPLRAPRINDYVVVGIQEHADGPLTTVLRRLIGRTDDEITVQQFQPTSSKPVVLKLAHVVQFYRVMTTNDLLGA
jgi:hypothetical protein